MQPSAPGAINSQPVNQNLQPNTASPVATPATPTSVAVDQFNNQGVAPISPYDFPLPPSQPPQVSIPAVTDDFSSPTFLPIDTDEPWQTAPDLPSSSTQPIPTMQPQYGPPQPMPIQSQPVANSHVMQPVQTPPALTMDSYLSSPPPAYSEPAAPAVGVAPGQLDPAVTNQTPPRPTKIQQGRSDAITTSEALNPKFGSEQAYGRRRNRNRGRNRNQNHNRNPNPTGNSDASRDEVIAEIEALEAKVAAANLPIELAERASRSIERLRRMAKRGSYTGEFETVEKYIYWITSIKWNSFTEDNLDVSNAKRIMDQSHYGMNMVKNLVLDYLAVMQLQMNNGIRFDNQNQNTPSSSGVPDMAVLRGSSANAPVMLFVGLQGVGKTSIAKSIANAMGRKFSRVALGAIGSVQALRGQSKAFLDAEPGMIIKALIRCGTMNPVILLDEIDKSSGNSSLLNDIMAALLEILDPEQNSSFIDHYIDFPVDLSKVFFICTANNLGSLSAALLDRMEVIRFTSYTDEEKTVIAKNYSMPKVLKNTGLSLDQLHIQEDVWPILVRPVGFDAGLRQLERNLATLVRAAARRILDGTQTPIVITPENVREFVLPDQGPLS